MRYLITGGAGFIGSNLVSGILERNAEAEITVFDNLSSNALDFDELSRIRGVKCVEGDIRNGDLVQNVVRGHDVVFHLAAQTGVAGSERDPIFDCEMNVLSSLRLLSAASAAGCSSFVAASSNACLGDVETPFNEMSLPRPVSCYGVSKLAMEYYMAIYDKSSSMNVSALRFSNVYGPNSHKKGSVVSTFLKAGFQDGCLHINGDGSQSRDFIYVADICQALISAVDYDGASKYSKFCIGTGFETSVIDLAKLIQIFLFQKEGIKISLKFTEARPGDVISNCADISLARDVLNFRSRMSLDKGLAPTWESIAKSVKGKLG